MSVPGSNLLLEALEVLAPIEVEYYRDLGERTTTDTGMYVTVFAAMVLVCEGQIQPIQREKYSNLGLDLAKNYVTWFVAQDVIDVQRNCSGDQLVFGGKRYQLVNQTNWSLIDGWCYAQCVEIGNA